jgi:hypothetical protein
LTVNVYIDGFNFYYCAVYSTQYKWLNPILLCSKLFPLKTIGTVKYFSARVKALPHDTGAPTRQDIYWRALRTLPQIEIIQGHFVAWPKLLPQFPFAYLPDKRGPQKVQIHKAEEKGSDVNLASYLIYDNCQALVDESIVISNDSDLAHAIEIVTTKLKRPVTIVNPNRTYALKQNPKACSLSSDLKKVATGMVISINDNLLACSQFPIVLVDDKGTFSKPPSW